MKRLYCDTMIDLAEWMFDEACDGKIVACVFDYHDSCDLLHHLMKCGQFGAISLDIHAPEFDDYDGEYIITLDDCGDALFAERAKIGDQYLKFEADILVAAPYVGSKIMNNNCNECGLNFEIVMSDDDEFCKSDCEYCIDIVGCQEESENSVHDDEEDHEIEVTIDIDGESSGSKISFVDALMLLQDWLLI